LKRFSNVKLKVVIAVCIRDDVDQMLPELQCSEDVEPSSCVDSSLVEAIDDREQTDNGCTSDSAESHHHDNDHAAAADEDGDVVRRLVLVKRSAADGIVDSTLDYRLKDLAVMQDDGLTDFTVAQVLMRVCYSSLTSLYLVDCPLLQLGDETAEMMVSLPLTALVLTRTSQRRIPRAVFRLRSLEVLKVDGNCRIANNDFSVVRHLIIAGADVNIKDQVRVTSSPTDIGIVFVLSRYSRSTETGCRQYRTR